VRTRRYAYVERYELRTATVEEGLDAALGAGELVDRELYDLRRDPYQLESRHASGRYTATQVALAAVLARLRACAGPDCLLEVAVPAPERR
jgi:hypothetical protein